MSNVESTKGEKNREDVIDYSGDGGVNGETKDYNVLLSRSLKSRHLQMMAIGGLGMVSSSHLLMLVFFRRSHRSWILCGM